MIRARARGRSTDFVLLGLSRRNAETLGTRAPLTFDGACIGMPGVSFLLFQDETERGILDEFDKRGLLSPDRGISPEARAALYAAADRADAGKE